MSATRPPGLAAWGLLFAAPLLFATPAGRAFADDPTPPPDAPMDGGQDPAPGADGGANAGGDDGSVPFLENVGKAIDRGVAWLKKKQLSDGSWGPITADGPYDPNSKGTPYQYPAGSTALALYALLKCEVPVSDPVVKKGFAFLKSKYPRPGTSYETSMALLAVTATADPFKRSKDSRAAGERVKLTGEWRKWAEDLQTLLLHKHKGLGWRYNNEGPNMVPSVPPGGDQDLSSTQLAVLALFSAERCGIPAPSQVYADAMKFALLQQETDGRESERVIVEKAPAGKAPPPPSDPRYAKPVAPQDPPKDKSRGFCYIKNEKLPEKEWKATGAMTGCGLATLLMSRYILMKRADAVWKKQDAKGIQQSIFDGYAWIDQYWDPGSNPPMRNSYDIYYAYCVERACDLTGNSLIGKANWYVEMGQHLIDTQKDGKEKTDGFWDTQTTHGPHDVLDTCFALLFLKRATRGGIPYPTVTGGSDDAPTDGRSSGGDGK